MRNLITGIVVCLLGGVGTLVCLLLPATEGSATYIGSMACVFSSSLIFLLLGLIFLVYGIVETSTSASERARLLRGAQGDRDEDEEDEEEDDYDDDEE